MCNEKNMTSDLSESMENTAPLSAHDFYRQAEYFLTGSNGVTRSENNALHCYQMAAQMGHIPAITAKGYMYQMGYGTEEAAFELYKEAANAGEATAMYNLAFCYATATGTQPDYRLASVWCEKAARAGNANAQASLVFFLNQGLENSQVVKQLILDSLQSAANSGHSAALYYLGELYETGSSDLNIEADASMSAQYYAKAAKGDSAAAKYHVACEKLQAPETLQDRDEGIRLLHEAANLGYFPAKCHEKCNIEPKQDDWSSQLPLCKVQRPGCMSQYIHTNSIRERVQIWIRCRFWRFF